MTQQQAIAELKQALGPKGWLAGDDMASHEVDVRDKFRGQALLVARPAATDEVVEVLRICRRHGIAVVPQGGNTSLVGGAVPTGERPQVILWLARMNRILEVDPDGYTITAEAGVILEQLHEAAAAVDRTFAMDWGARGTATVGGGISTNAGGINVLRYGSTRHQVLGLEVVLPDGRVWDGMRALRKDSSGYDLKQLFIGAEGTLGIVTKAVLKLYPRAAHQQSLFAAVSDIDRLLELFALARAVANDGLTAFELLPGRGVDLAAELIPTIQRPLDTPADWYVLVRFAGPEPVEVALTQLYQQAFEAGLVTDAVLAASQAQEANLWHLRDEVPGMRTLGGERLKWDVAVPLPRIIAFHRQVERLAEAILPGLWVYSFGHVGDGNLHLSIRPGPGIDTDAFQAVAERVVDEVDRLVWEYGGTICAEHGIGSENYRRIRGQKPALEFELMARIRELFDPDGLLNPDKVIDRAWGDSV